MYNFLNKNGQLIAFGVGIFITIIFYMVAMGGMDGFNVLDKESKGTTGIFNFGLIAAILLFIICGVLLVGFGLWQIIANPKAAKKGIIGVVALLAVFLIAYAMSKPETTGPLVETIEKFKVTGGQSKYISASITTTIILGLLAVGLFVVAEVRNFFK